MTILGVLLFFCSGNTTSATYTTPYLGDERDNTPVDLPFDLIKRYSLTYGYVACWQNDGIWIGRLTPVELSSLGINRFQDTERSLN